MAIRVGEKIPDVPLSIVTPDGPQPTTSAGGADRAWANRGPNAAEAPGSARGAAQRHGGRGPSTTVRLAPPSAAASASAWRALPARPSLSDQIWGESRVIRDDCPIYAIISCDE